MKPQAIKPRDVIPDRIWVLVAAAGSGQRMGSATAKQFLEIAGRTVLEHTLDAISEWPQVGQVVLVTRPEDRVLEMLSAPPVHPLADRIHEVDGGATRADSVLNGLLHIRNYAEQDAEHVWVMVHDAARPLVRAADIQKLCDQVSKQKTVGGLLAVPVSDTLKRSDSRQRIQQTVSRDQLWHAQTPQLFRLAPLIAAMSSARAEGTVLTDEASAMETAGAEVLLVHGSDDNIKITRPLDLYRAESLMRERGSLQPIAAAKETGDKE